MNTDKLITDALGQWISNHSEDEQNEAYLTTSTGETYTLKHILSEIMSQTEFGQKMARGIAMLAVDLLARGKKQVSEGQPRYNTYNQSIIIKEHKKINAPKQGWQKEIALLVGCTTATVNNAIHRNAPGLKAEKARQLYRARYLNS